ncbi:MAG: GNAT family N-acetyltransferase [Acidobacteria bacterium]|nr:GNAT family N-acetyltransferase [Acidobacteriota bacterium]
MNGKLVPRHDLTPNEIDALEESLYRHNSRATGRVDAQGLGFTICDDDGQVIAAAAGFTWSGISELKQMWVDERYRGLGYARRLLQAYIAEARVRGVRWIWVASFDFQAPGLYEKLGFRRMAEFSNWPEGHTNVILCKTLADPDD